MQQLMRSAPGLVRGGAVMCVVLSAMFKAWCADIYNGVFMSHVISSRAATRTRAAQGPSDNVKASRCEQPDTDAHDAGFASHESDCPWPNIHPAEKSNLKECGNNASTITDMFESPYTKESNQYLDVASFEG